MKNYPNIRLFLFFLIGLGIINAAFIYMPSINIHIFLLVIYGFIGLGAFVIIMPFIRFLMSRADLIHLLVADQSGEGFHVISSTYNSGGESASGGWITIFHSFFILNSGKFYREEMDSYENLESPKVDLKNIESLALFKPFKNSLKELCERTGKTLKPNLSASRESLGVFLRKGDLSPKDLERSSDEDCIFVFNKQETFLHLALVAQQKIVWKRKIQGKWYGDVKQPLVVGEHIVLATQRASFPSEVFCLSLVHIPSGRVVWRKKL